MLTPLSPNSRSTEETSISHAKEDVSNIRKHPQSYPGMEDRMYPVHDRGMCEWISDAFWAVIDVLDSIYTYVVDKVLCLFEKLGIIKPRQAAPHPPFAFSDKARDAIKRFPNYSPLEQMDKFEDILNFWEGEAEEHSELIHVLVHQLSSPLKRLLIQFAGGALPEERLGDYMLGMSPDQYHTFRERAFTQFSIEMYPDKLTSEGVPQEEIPLLLMLKIMEAVPHPVLDQGINAEWIYTQLRGAKEALTDAQWGYLLQAYNQREGVKCSPEEFQKVCADIPYRRHAFIPLFKQAVYHVPTRIHTICEEIYAGNNENRLALFQNNTVWAEAFLDSFLNSSIRAQIETDPGGNIQAEIAKHLQTRWEEKQKEDGFDGDAVTEAPFKEGILEEVTVQVKDEAFQSLRKTMIGQGWCIDEGAEALLAQLDAEADAQTVHAAMRAACPGI